MRLTSSGRRTASWEAVEHQGVTGLPVVSVVSVTRRNAEALQRTLTSLLDFAPDIELVVVEGDDQRSAEYASLQAWASQRFPRLVWSRAPDGGPYDAMNRGLVASTGDWVWFLNSGDTVADGVVADDVFASLSADGREHVWAIFDAVTDGLGGPVRRSLSRDYTVKGLRSGSYMACHQAVLVRRLTLANLGGFDSAYRICADYALFLRCARQGAPLLRDGVLVISEDGGLHTQQVRLLHREKRRARRELVDQDATERVVDLLRTSKRVVSDWASSTKRRLSPGE